MSNEWVVFKDNSGAYRCDDSDLSSYINVERYGNCLEVTIVNGTDVRTVDIPCNVVKKVMPIVKSRKPVKKK